MSKFCAPLFRLARPAKGRRQSQSLFTGLITASALSLSACSGPSAPIIPNYDMDAISIDVLADDLSWPWAVEAVSDEAFLVTGNRGRLWRVDTAGRTEISGLPKDITEMATSRLGVEGQGGLLDIALAPDFQQSGEVYLSYSYGTWEANGTGLLRARLQGDQLLDPVTIFRSNPAKRAGSHFGGRITFLPDDTVLLSLGDGFALREEAQKPSSHLGSIVRLTRDGGVPADNPDFSESADRGEAKPQLYSIGHRNVQGLWYDVAAGVIWAHEHGPKGGDEINRIEAGGNYGWPIVTEGRDYQGARISPFESDPRFKAAEYGWTPSIAPSGLAIYRGEAFSDWSGHALVGGLASRDVRLVDLASGEEQSLLGDYEGGQRVRDVTLGTDGSVLVLMEANQAGRLLRLRPKTP